MATTVKEVKEVKQSERLGSTTKDADTKLRDSKADLLQAVKPSFGFRLYRDQGLWVADFLKFDQGKMSVIKTTAHDAKFLTLSKASVWVDQQYG